VDVDHVLVARGQEDGLGLETGPRQRVEEGDDLVEAVLGTGQRVVAGDGPVDVVGQHRADAVPLGIALVAEGNAALYDRHDIVSIPVVDLPPCELALAWRADDHRDVLRDLVELVTRRRGPA